LKLKLLSLAAIAVLVLASQAFAQNPQAALASLPDADALVYVNMHKIFNEAAPRVAPPEELTKMRAAFADLKKTIGIDPSTLEYVVLAIRFNKPAADLSFVAPDVMAVISGDFSSDSLMTLGQLHLQERARVEKYGSRSIVLVKIDPIAEQAEKNPILKPFAELGAIPLSANSIAIGNLRYLKSAADAADGNGRISTASLESLLRDSNALIAASGAPLASFAKSFGLLGLENTTRDPRCDTRFGNFYAAITMNETNYTFRGAMNADNPDTAKIINNLLSGLVQQGLSSVPDKDAQKVLESLKMTTKESEVVWEADVPVAYVADFLRTKSTAKKDEAPASAPRRPVRKKRTRK
jgi:hypothetical protein